MTETVTLQVSWLGWLIAWAIACKVFGSVMIGLWLGERGRRKVAEMWATVGNPNAPKAESFAPTEEAEDRFIKAGRATEELVIERVMNDPKHPGHENVLALRRAGLSDKEIRRDLLAMASGHDVEGD